MQALKAFSFLHSLAKPSWAFKISIPTHCAQKKLKALHGNDIPNTIPAIDILDMRGTLKTSVDISLNNISNLRNEIVRKAAVFFFTNWQDQGCAGERPALAADRRERWSAASFLRPRGGRA